MKFIILVLAAASILAAISCRPSRDNAAAQYTYRVDDKQLYDTILKLDSIFFGHYNNCVTELDQYSSFYLDSVEFYHDKGGLSNSRTAVVESTRKFVCGKVTRHLVKGSVEVYPVPGFGAIEMGLHTFFNKEEPNAPRHPGRFTIFWQQTPAGWKISKVISLH